MKRILVLWVSFGCAFLTLQLSQAGLQPYDLRVNGVPNAAGVDSDRPFFSWRLKSDFNGDRQIAYQILVAGELELLEVGKADYWDSGRIVSSEHLRVPYAGKPLESGCKLWWKVRVWDVNGRASSWSEPAWFIIGVINSNDWRAVWILSNEESNVVRFRREFVLKSTPKRAIVFFSTLGHYRAFVNGCQVGDRLFTPAWSAYEKTIFYDTYEITALLRPGTNAIGVEVAPGMYNVVRNHRFAKFTRKQGPLRVLCQLQVEYPDGSRETITSDCNWRVSKSPIIFSSIYGGEDFDGRLEEEGWAKPGFNAEKWGTVSCIPIDPRQLKGVQDSPWPIKVVHTNKPIGIKHIINTDSGGDVYIVDLGQNASHIPWIRVNGSAGTRVVIRPSEVLDEYGLVNQRTMGAKPERGFYWCEFFKGKHGVEDWSPKFWYIGCRYLQVELYPHNSNEEGAKLVDAAGLVVHGTAPESGSFECSDPWLQRIRSLVRWAQRSNLQNVFTDCPHREKLGWLEQCHLNGPSLMYEFDLARNFMKTIRDMKDAQTEEGLVPNIAPEYTRFKGTFRAAAEWGSASILVPWQQYVFNGDTNLLHEAYPMMQRYFTYLESRATNEILSEGLGDWYDLGPEKPGAAQLTPPEFTATAFYFYDALTMAKVARVLGRHTEAKYYSKRAESIKAAFNRRFLDSKRGVYSTGSQAANAIPLAMGIVPTGFKSVVLSNLVASIEANDYGPTAGDVGFRFVLRALADNDKSDIVYKMVTQSNKPGYVYQILLGETTLTESWDANLTSSHNHFMLGSVIEWLYHDLLGIQPLESAPGFKEFVIKPSVLNEIVAASGFYESVRGRIGVSWTNSPGRYKLRVQIPPGSKANVFVFNNGRGTVKVVNPVTRAASHPKRIQTSGKYVVYRVSSGLYEFDSTF